MLPDGDKNESIAEFSGELIEGLGRVARLGNAEFGAEIFDAAGLGARLLPLGSLEEPVAVPSVADVTGTRVGVAGVDVAGFAVPPQPATPSTTQIPETAARIRDAPEDGRRHDCCSTCTP